MFIRFDMSHERDRRTDRQMDGQTPHDGIGRAYHHHHHRLFRRSSHILKHHTINKNTKRKCIASRGNKMLILCRSFLVAWCRNLVVSSLWPQLKSRSSYVWYRRRQKLLTENYLSKIKLQVSSFEIQATHSRIPIKNNSRSYGVIGARLAAMLLRPT